MTSPPFYVITFPIFKVRNDTVYAKSKLKQIEKIPHFQEVSFIIAATVAIQGT